MIVFGSEHRDEVQPKQESETEHDIGFCLAPHAKQHVVGGEMSRFNDMLTSCSLQVRDASCGAELLADTLASSVRYSPMCEMHAAVTLLQLLMGKL